MKREDIFGKLTARLEQLKKKKNVIQRGFDYEAWIGDLFKEMGFHVHGSFRRKSTEEQIDGAIHHNDHTFLVEAKWLKNPVDGSEIDCFTGRLKRATSGTQGLFFSYSGFNESAVNFVRDWKSSFNIFLVDQSHVDALLNRVIDGKTWLTLLQNIASRTGELYIPIEDVLKEEKQYWKEKQPEDDWQSTSPPPIEAVDTDKLPITGSELFGREAELALLDAAWADGSIRVQTVVAWGGVGKTALINGWLNLMAQDNYRGAERVYGWSFYSQGAAEGKQASAEIFMQETLSRFGDPDPQEGTAEEKGRRLAELVRAQKILLILDGLEPLQRPANEAYGQEGRLKDRGLAVLLRQLAAAQPGLCLITSRERVTDLLNQTGATVKEMNLEQLSTPAGVTLLKKVGVKGRDQDMKQAVGEYGGHALALTLLGNYISVCCNGDIRKRDTIPHLTDERSQGGHAKRVMAAYCNHLKDSPELDILFLMGLFDRPADEGAIAVLRQEPAIIGVTERLQNLPDVDWLYALAHLRKAHLLAEVSRNPDNVGSLDCHPLIREYFGERLSEEHPDGFKASHKRLYHYYKDLPEKKLPDTLEEMAPLFAAIAHGCAAGLHQSALEDVYWKRVKRGDEHYSTRKLGAFGSDLATLSHFFSEPWATPATGLTESDQALVLSWAAFRLRALGRLVEAVEAMQTTLERYKRIEDPKEIAIAASNLGELLLALGRVAEAKDYGRQSVKYADDSRDAFWKMAARATAADALLAAGEREAAEVLFREAEEMQKERQPEYPILYSLQGFQYCDLLLEKGEIRRVVERAEKTLKWVSRENLLLSIGLDNLTLGRAHLALSRELLRQGEKEEEEAARSRAGEFLQKAVAGLRSYGSQQHLPRGLLARAGFFREVEEYEKAWADLDEALEIIEAGAMKLHLVDYHLEDARLCLEQNRQEEGKAHREAAKKLIGETGYKRRLKDLDGLD
jgi:tetratricopeptide (TPR) repeat protein